MTRYQQELAHLRRYLDALLDAPSLNSEAVENLLRAHVQQPAFNIAWRETLVQQALHEGVHWRTNHDNH